MIVISACLAGFACRYDGKDNLVECIRDLYERGEAVIVCPEVYGGMPTPRIPSERSGDRVINEAGEDVTEYFVRGSLLSLKKALDQHCTGAVLKANSPSCGCRTIYDGTFSRTKKEGKGVFAELLEARGIPCMDEHEYRKQLEKRIQDLQR